MERNIDMRQTVEEAAHLFAESRSSGSAFPAYYHGFIAGAEWERQKAINAHFESCPTSLNTMIGCAIILLIAIRIVST